MSTFLGIGAGPIQTGIFVSGAARGGYTRIVLADVDRDLIRAVRGAGSIIVNTACRDSVRSDAYAGIEIYNPADAAELEALMAVASEATAVVTALPSTAFYKNVAPWLSAAFQSAPDRGRYVYAAENSTTAAAELRGEVGAFPNTHYLDTVIGKMSKVFTSEESDLPPLAPGLGRGHLVEEFNDIYTNSAPVLTNVRIEGLYPKANLHPFEEAKLYGHNTVHFLLAFLAKARGCRYMDEVSAHADLVAIALEALTVECGAALCRKHGGMDPFFELNAFRRFAEVLVERMTSPVLKDSIERVVRDPDRKLGWNDRMIGAIRLCLDQDVYPVQLMTATAVMARQCFGPGQTSITTGLSELWKNVPAENANNLIREILQHEA